MLKHGGLRDTEKYSGASTDWIDTTKLSMRNLGVDLITFVNGLEPDQDRHNVGPGLDPHRLTLC